MAGRLLDMGNIDLWRSEEMQLVQLMIPADAAHDTVEALGEIGLLQFKDLNVDKSAFQRTYANQVRRCDELARKLRFFKEQIEKAGVPVATRSLLDTANVTMDELEGLLEQLEREMVEMNANHDRLQRAAAELAELSLLLDCAGRFFDSARRAASGAGTMAGGLAAGVSGPGSTADVSSPLLGGGGGGGLGAMEASSSAYEPKIGRLGSIAGLVARERLAGFERLLFRATRGNNYFRSMAVGKVLDPATGEQVDKAVFVVFFAGERARVKIGKVRIRIRIRLKCYKDGAILDIEDRRDCGHHGGELEMDRAAGPYAFGVDPIWHGTKTELPFLNSMKMKMSILVGVAHMNLGIIMSVLNNNYFRDRLSTICEFVPQMIFLNGLFGYLSALIVGKWASGSTADLYHVMIYMFLKPGDVDAQGFMFSGQAFVQVTLLLVALVAVPWMLLPKPLILKARAEAAAKARGEYHRLEHGDQEAGGHAAGAHAAAAHGGGGHGGGHGHGEHFEFGEVMVHQMIHTIEFVLGAVSNTASYLRLWALSLAHSQLSAVFYDRVLMMTIQVGSPYAMVVGFFVFAVATLGVLMVMESLSAFLHALRLHWVEFQNKFYRGDGYAFVPFHFGKEHAAEE
ncbi:hypothetical protein GPECTOR_16g747 [Gonium pectorale]|uniref:V-type proton ATPase subunit a n=1 Tax=Gonium pectorale TaxID=33097 RepID=A0A150GL86_GONPE|nr:hypothetical protein GPECTOR_16g747 [Gonium pectorale]|eukprot:KXZ50572.1 hypothetical protein GPECTOR_16g747 [Gonium pectorale]